MNTLEVIAVRFIAKCPKCKAPKAIDRPARIVEKQHYFQGRPTVKTSQINPIGSPYYEAVTCAHCGFVNIPCHYPEWRWKRIEGKLSEDHVCDARCMNATGPNCECSCAGANHGGNHL